MARPCPRWLAGLRPPAAQRRPALSPAARQRASALVKRQQQPYSTERRAEAGADVAFAFDIDGVLYQGRQAVPGAREVLRRVRSLGIRYVFLTNGGGAHEAAKAESLAKRLGLSGDEDVIGDRVIVSHTPMRGWPEAAKQQTVLITGSDPETARAVATQYGFSRAVTPADLVHANPSIYPFDALAEGLHARRRALPDGKAAAPMTDPYAREPPAEALKIDKILVWNDPRDWSLDIQLCHDLLVSHRGYLGTISALNGDASLPNRGWQQDGQPELWVSNLDLVWKTEFPVNRFGTGAFVAALRGVWAAVTGGAELRFHALGKPSTLTYDYAHGRLLAAGDGGDGARRPLRRVYMIGDNPESDIRGANDFDPKDGAEWVPILVRTGVWRPTAAESEPKHRPAVVVDDVVDAIGWALQREGMHVTREWLTGGD